MQKTVQESDQCLSERSKCLLRTDHAVLLPALSVPLEIFVTSSQGIRLGLHVDHAGMYRMEQEARWRTKADQGTDAVPSLIEAADTVGCMLREELDSVADCLHTTAGPGRLHIGVVEAEMRSELGYVRNWAMAHRFRMGGFGACLDDPGREHKRARRVVPAVVHKKVYYADLEEGCMRECFVGCVGSVAGNCMKV